MLERMIVNDIDITDLKNHPRILELRFIATYDRWSREFGDKADAILTGLAAAFHCDINKLRAVANQSVAIRKINKDDRGRFIQEAVVMGMVWKEKRYTVATKYLKLASRTLYAQPTYVPKNFIDSAWVARLDAEIVACGLKQYAIEVERFLDSLKAFTEVI